jgi:hypothetical protein
LHAANEIAEEASFFSFGAGEGGYKSDFWWELLVIWCSRLELIKMKKIQCIRRMLRTGHMHIRPWLQSSNINLNLRKQTEYLALGTNSFWTSIKWFMVMCPCDLTEIHASKSMISCLTFLKKKEMRSTRTMHLTMIRH